MPSSSSYGSYTQSKTPAYPFRPTTSSSTQSTYTNASGAYSSSSSSSSRSQRYSKPPVIHNGGGKINDPNTSTSAPNGGYYN